MITGASSGIGAALARIYGETGRRISLIARDRPRLEKVASDCRSLGAEADIYIADVTDASATAEVIMCCDRQQPIDLLIANAGIGGIDSLALDCSESGHAARRIFETNAIGVINSVTPLLPLLIARRRGQIAIVSSLAALIELPSCPVYCASKAAIRAYGAALRRRLAASGLHISVICPGFVETPMSASLPFRLPFVWTADRAARYMVRFLEKGRKEIQFPWPLVVAIYILRALPRAITDSLLIKLRPKVMH